MKVVILVGSSDVKSHSLSLGQAIAAELENLQVEPQLLNLIDLQLPLYDRSLERTDSQPESVRKFLDLSRITDAFVWVTPIYHNSFSAMLKNALDWQHAMKFPDKVVGLASNGGNRSPQAVDQLMLVARSQGYVVTPKRVCTTESDYSEDLVLTDEAIKVRINDFCAQFTSLVAKMK